MKNRLLYLLAVYAITILLFVAAKIVFLLCYGSSHGAVWGDYLAVIGHGLTLDLSTALYVVVVPLVVVIASVWTGVSRWVLRVYHAVVGMALALAFIADTSLYAFWGFKLDASCIGYLESPTEAVASVTTGYMVLRAVVLIVVSTGIYMLYAIPCGMCGVAGKRPNAKLQSKVRETLFYVACMPLMVIGLRGGIGESTTNIGQAYFSQNQFLNHAAVNPVFSFVYSLGHGMGDASEYEFFEESEALQLVADIYTTESTNSDTLLTTTRPNIVVILMESAGEEFASAMPRLQELKKEGVDFGECYGNSWRTDRGTVCALSGYPSFPTVSVMKMPEKSRRLPGIARTLQGQGYKTSYLYGGDINFTNMRSYLISTGWEMLTSKDDYGIGERSSAQWGVRDDITFGTLLDMVRKQRLGDDRFLIGYSTLSSHEPWDVPTHTIPDDETLNAFAYLDNCIGDFVDSLRHTPAWADLLIILTADHGINYKDIDLSKPKAKNHIPMVWIGGAVKSHVEVSKLCNQSDLAATLLGQMRLPHDDMRFSRDILSDSYAYPTAVHNYNNAQWLIDSTGQIVYDFGADRFSLCESVDSARMLRLNKAIMQVTTSDLKKR